LDRCTIRNSGPVIQLIAPSTAAIRPGRLTLSAVDCVFSPEKEFALIELARDHAAIHVMNVRWTGRDSLMEVGACLVARRDQTDVLEPIDESSLTVTGLAQSPLEFEGNQLETASASQLRRWQAPRQSLDPPGIIAANLTDPPANLTSDRRDIGLQ
jgi:hypothetical protein